MWGFCKNVNNGVIKLKTANKLDHPRREAKVLIILKIALNAFSCLLGDINNSLAIMKLCSKPENDVKHTEFFMRQEVYMIAVMKLWIA